MKDPRSLIEARYGHLPFEPPAEVPEALAALLDRRVTRRFKPDAIPEPLLNIVLAAAQSAPSKSDMQQYSIVVLEDAKRIAAIADWIGTMPWIKDAPVLLIFCADIRRNREICERAGLEHANDNLDTLLNATVDGALALGMCVAAADAAGLGTCPISYVRNHMEKVAPLLSLPKGVFPIAGLSLGWPAARNEPSARLPPSVIIHRDRYSTAGEPEALAAYDARRERAKPRYPEIHGPAPEGCSWTENVARQLSVPERAGFRAWLRSRGFALD
ncbi:nitroreductase family protein [Sediminicoccus sp. BL-A-41-H5]|uniref:nitroreductase family protein n=1 Tax=Sediminicoccus sp. BL-A-41-H5 TaxID=3421106 RepID=UPI003D666F67